MPAASTTPRCGPARRASSASNSVRGAPPARIAIVQIAVFDAVNAIEGGYTSYTDLGPAPAGASLKAAISQAAHDTLVALFPSQAATFDAELGAFLARFPTINRRATAARWAPRRRPPILALRAGRRIAACRAERRRRIHHQRRSRQVASGSHQSHPARARRALGRGRAVRHDLGVAVPRSAAARA